MLPHAPGVQMQAIPEDAVHEDSGDEDGEDPDKRISSKIVPLCGFCYIFWFIKRSLQIEGFFFGGPRTSLWFTFREYTITTVFSCPL